MARITEQIMLVFQDELEKQAVNWTSLTGAARKAGGYLSRQATTAGGGAALGGAAGGGLGALAGGVQGYRQARQEGASGGQAALGGLSGALRGGSRGALVGAGVGGAAGLAGGAGARRLVGKLRGGEGALSSISRFGERQAHGLTGALPEGMTHGGAMKALRMGVIPREQELSKAMGEAYKFRRLGKEALDAPGVSGLASKAYKKEMAASKAFGHALELQKLKATSVPGYLKALATEPVQTVKASLGEAWHGSGTGLGGAANKALTFGLPTVGVVQALHGSEEEGGASQGQRVGQALGGLAFGLTGGIPLAGQMALTGLGSKGFEAAGKGVDLLRGKRGKLGLMDTLQLGRNNARSIRLSGPEPETADVSTHGLEVEHGPGVAGGLT